MGPSSLEILTKAMWIRARTIGALLTALLFTVGCESPRYTAVPLFPGKGAVMNEGAPAVGAVVRLDSDPPRPDDLIPVGRVGEDGSFRLTTYENEDGAPPGKYRVTIRWPEPRKGEASGPPVDRLKGRYA